MPALTDLQKRTAQAIVNIFETGRAYGDYAQVTVVAGDNGHLTYGRSQTTLASGNLYLLIKSYCGAQGGYYSEALGSYLPRLEACDLALDKDSNLQALLKQAGSDPVMHSEQDEFFDRIYWEPALKSAAAIGAQCALATSIVYDSKIHGSWTAMRDLTNQRFGNLAAVGEQTWFAHYVATRKEWIENNANALLRKCSYRMAAFMSIMDEGKWNLALPMNVRGQMLTEQQLSAAAAVRISAGDAAETILRLRAPCIEGAEVRALQEALNAHGIALKVDSVFGATTDSAVKLFQQQSGLVVDGVVGPATRSALGLTDRGA